MLRKQYNITQEDLSIKSGVGLRFVRDLEQGKQTLRLDKVNQLLDFFNYEMAAVKKEKSQERRFRKCCKSNGNGCCHGYQTHSQV